MQTHVISLRWKNKEPYLLTRNSKGFERVLLKPGEQIGFGRTGKRSCIGYFHKGYRKCPLNRKVSSPQRRCEHCKNLDTFWPCVTCNGEECKASPRQRKRCLETTHAVYLVAFGEIIKVGVTKYRRVWERWIEQGADFGVILSKHNGKEARKLESEISKELKDKVYFKEKVKELGNWSERKLKERIEELGLEAASHIYPVFQEYLGLNNFRDIKITEELNKGRIKGIKGPILIYENQGEKFAYNLKSLVAEFIQF